MCSSFVPLPSKLTVVLFESGETQEPRNSLATSSHLTMSNVLFVYATEFWRRHSLYTSLWCKTSILVNWSSSLHPKGQTWGKKHLSSLHHDGCNHTPPLAIQDVILREALCSLKKLALVQEHLPKDLHKKKVALIIFMGSCTLIIQPRKATRKGRKDLAGNKKRVAH